MEVVRIRNKQLFAKLKSIEANVPNKKIGTFLNNEGESVDYTKKLQHNLMNT